MDENLLKATRMETRLGRLLRLAGRLRFLFCEECEEALSELVDLAFRAQLVLVRPRDQFRLLCGADLGGRREGTSRLRRLLRERGLLDFLRRFWFFLVLPMPPRPSSC